ncbi:hypothetical protein I4U23_010984 [Adineta vaga]|nr:hypothetical protein I4U23_010984 [Adineta vaga]
MVPVGNCLSERREDHNGRYYYDKEDYIHTSLNSIILLFRTPFWLEEKMLGVGEDETDVLNIGQNGIAGDGIKLIADALKINIVDEFFLGSTGASTLFAIECDNGKDIRQHSVYENKDEILSPPDRQFEVISCLRHLVELVLKVSLSRLLQKQQAIQTQEEHQQHNMKDAQTIQSSSTNSFCFDCRSALFIIFGATRQRSKTQKDQKYKDHVRTQLIEHKQLIISPIVLLILSSPRLIIALLPGCIKISEKLWIYLSAYFISFTPSVLIFIIFVYPSEIYMKAFKQSLTIARWRTYRQ